MPDYPINPDPEDFTDEEFDEDGYDADEGHDLED